MSVDSVCVTCVPNMSTPSLLPLHLAS